MLTKIFIHPNLKSLGGFSFFFLLGFCVKKWPMFQCSGGGQIELLQGGYFP